MCPGVVQSESVEEGQGWVQLLAASIQEVPQKLSVSCEWIVIGCISSRKKTRRKRRKWDDFLRLVCL